MKKNFVIAIMTTQTNITIVQIIWNAKNVHIIIQIQIRRVIDITIDDITEKIIETRNNDIAKAFTMHIGSLLLNNGIVPVMTEYTGNDVKNITDTNEYKLVMEYGVALKELDCSKHDKEIYNKAIDDFVKFANTMPTVETEDGEIRPMRLEEMAEQLKEGEIYD